MFGHSMTTFMPDFQPESLLTREQRECYRARAQALRSRFPWSSALDPVWSATLIHLSANVPGKVAYYASVDNLMANRLTRTSPEMFLQRTLTYAPEEIKAAWSCEVLGHTLPEVLFASNTDPDTWIHVYERGPRSCMAGSTLVSQYAHPDNNLALAYVQGPHDRVLHRTVVNTKTKRYVRVYSEENAGFFVAALNKLGYQQSNDALEDEIIHADYRECEHCGRDVLIGPYLDGNHQELQLDRHGKPHGKISSCGDFMKNSTSPICSRCEDGDYDDDEGDGDEE